MKAIFDTKPDSGYDDDIARRYHFPNNAKYLEAAHAAIGDWIVYREPQRNGGRRAYIGVALVESVEPDPARSDHSYAYVRDFLPFDRDVPFNGGGGFSEGWLRELPDPKKVGVAIQGKSVRALSEADFRAIVSAGLEETLDPENARRLELDDRYLDEPTRRLLEAPLYEREREIVQVLINKKIRAANFRHHVLEAYQDRCAVTGLQMINGGGKPEAQAAHIWSVADGGPDTVQNGIALSGTVHWLFDRHLISLTPEYGLLVAHNRVPTELRSLFEKQLDRIHLPQNPKLWPNPNYVQRHRERFMGL